MPYGSIALVPGVNVERTPTLLRAGISSSSLIRFRDGLVQKFGGWKKFYPFMVSGVPRDLHGWLDLNENAHLSVGTTLQLGVITNGNFIDITPQTLVSNAIPQISTTANSAVVSITDPNVTNVTTLDSVFFNVPVSIGGLLIDGLYPIASITGTNSYTIIASKVATTTVTNPSVTNAGTAAGNPTLHFSATPAWVVAGMSVYDLTTPSAIPAGTILTGVGGTTATMSNNAAGAGVGSGDSLVFASIPVFTTTSGSSEVNVELLNHGVQAGVAERVSFTESTSGNGVTIFGSYQVLNVTDSNNFSIQASSQATASGTFPQNGGNMQLIYSITLGPTSPGLGYGLGNYGSGAYGFGTGSGSPQTGTKITAVDWTSDNWGEILIACPQGQGLYYYDPTGGFLNASIISSAPPFNNGMFISTTEQILIAFGSSVEQQIGYQRQDMLVQWSDVGNFFQWTPTVSDQAGNYIIPIGSKIYAGMAVANQNLLWTDLDLWSMSYIGFPDVFGFNQIGIGAGTVSSHAVQKLRGSVYWMGQTNFYSYTSGGVAVIPCPVWDVVFQNLNTAFLQNVRAMPNTPFNEAGWLFPSLASTSGECDSFVKMNITDPGAPWDYCIGSLPMQRSAWIDQTVLGMPISASSGGFIYQQETTNDADGLAMQSTFTTGFFYLVEGEDFVIIDQILPDFKWALFSGGASAQVQMTFNVCNYPGDTPRTYGPYTVTQSTKFISTRFRGRLVSITITSSDLGSFWRIGSIKYRYNKAGRR